MNNNFHTERLRLIRKSVRGFPRSSSILSRGNFPVAPFRSFSYHYEHFGNLPNVIYRREIRDSTVEFRFSF